MSPLRTCHPSPSLSLSLCRAGSHLRVPNARPGESARLSFKFSIFDLFDAEIASSTLKVTLLNSQRVAFAMLFSDFRAIQFPECCLFRNRKGRNDTFPFLPRNFLHTRRIFGKSTSNFCPSVSSVSMRIVRAEGRRYGEDAEDAEGGRIDGP